MFSWGTKIQITFHVECSEKKMFLQTGQKKLNGPAVWKVVTPDFVSTKICVSMIELSLSVSVSLSLPLSLSHLNLHILSRLSSLFSLSISRSLLLPPFLYLLWRPILVSFLSQLYDEFLVDIVQGCCNFAAVVTFSGSRKSDAKLMWTGHSHGAC